MDKISVFISSAMRELEAERETVFNTIESMGMCPLWFEGDAGVLGPVVESLRLVEASDIMCLILWQAYSDVVFKEYEKAVSLGRPIVVLDKTLKDGESRAKKLAKFREKVKNQHVYKRFRRLSELRCELVKGLQQVIVEIFISTVRRLPHDGIDTRIKQSLKTAKKVYILSRTPILLFGPRPYLSNDNKLQDEVEGYNLTKKLAKEAISGHKELRLVVSSCAVLDEIHKQENAIVAKLSKHVYKNLLHYKDKAKNARKFKLACTAISAVPPPRLTYIVADDEVIIWVKTPSINYCVTTKNRDLAFSFKFMFEEYFKLDRQKGFLQLLAQKLLENKKPTTTGSHS